MQADSTWPQVRPCTAPESFCAQHWRPCPPTVFPQCMLQLPNRMIKTIITKWFSNWANTIKPPPSHRCLIAPGRQTSGLRTDPVVVFHSVPNFCESYQATCPPRFSVLKQLTLVWRVLTCHTQQQTSDSLRLLLHLHLQLIPTPILGALSDNFGQFKIGGFIATITSWPFGQTLAN